MMMKKHKENRTNKIDELYKHGVKKIYQNPLSEDRKLNENVRNRYNKCPLITFREEEQRTYSEIK